MKVSVMRTSGAGRAILVAAACFILSGCGFSRTTPFSVVAPEIDLQAVIQQDAPVDWAIAVRRPVTDRTRDSEQILVRSDGFRLLPYPGAVWLDAAPDLLRALMIQALQTSGGFAAVDRVGRGGEFFVLETELLRFEAVDEGAGDLVVELELRASLINPRGGALIDAETFNVRQASADSSLNGLIPAFESALTDLVVELGRWTVSTDAQDPL
ncbi:MAG: ABC-type transport auxiliary lipoprotein family protein [Wenzhouxiangella sp.]|nr:ABC-type transport auxiliary lipoprotein family protein [Wenzhouxiangella sp.]